MLYANYNSKRGFRKSSRPQHGQSIVIALLVLLLLGLAGALFVTIVARNLINANHANRVTTADKYGSAGIAYADSQLSNSTDGADWRPPLQFALATPPTEARELARYNAAVASLSLVQANANDPDKAYLDIGYSRYNTGAGRFLLRLTYDPVNVLTKDPVTGKPSFVPPGKYIKIESIGREGTIETIDPTTYTNNRSSDRTQSYQVAYKPIGITDYARFETNPDKRSDIANLGVISEFSAADTDSGIATPGVFDFVSTNAVPPVSTPPTIREYPVLTTYGAPDAYLNSGTAFQPNPTAGSSSAVAGGSTAVPGGGSIHANMPLRFFGKNVIYLNDASTNNLTSGTPLFQDSAEVAGDLLLDNYDQKASLNNKTLDTTVTPSTGQQAALILNPTDPTKLGTTGTLIAPSNSSGALNGSFDTHNGLVRDGSMQNDPEGLPRGITRLEPPLMDSTDSASQLPRYKALAMNSAPRAANPVGSSQYGYGKAIYINNTADIQPDSASIGGSTTLTDEWLHGNTTTSSGDIKGNWNGHFYDPPGVNITLGQLLTPSSNGPPAQNAVFGLRLVRDDGNWQNPDGTPGASQALDVKYSDLDTDTTGVASDNNIVIYTEGNLRVRGILSPDERALNAANPLHVPRHITIVTDGTAYIEGNLLKGDPDSSITILAHDYVCVNTTQFLAGSNVENRTDGRTAPDKLVSLTDLPGVTGLTLDADHSLLQEFNFGLPGTDLPSASYGTSPLALYLSAGPALPGSPTSADINIFDTTGNTVFQAAPPVLQLGGFTRQTYDLSANTTNTFLNALPTDLFQLSVRKDDGQENPATGVSSTASQDVALERAAILPMDIRIEAVLYAQTRSFFVIPGDWFNSDPTDNLDSYLKTAARPNQAQNVDDTARFPMSGQPIDLKITIDGSVSEARPADIAAQSEWMRKWGWIPQYHGTLIGLTGNATETSGRVPAAQTPTQPAIGLQIIYNPQAGYPYHPAASPNAPAYYLRSDKFGRPLPFTPNLPVSTGLLYSGESGEPPLLQ